MLNIGHNDNEGEIIKWLVIYQYKVLFDGITDTIAGLECMVEKLKFLQQKAEETYISHECDLE